MAIRREIKLYIEAELKDYNDTLRAIEEERNDLLLSSPVFENHGGKSYEVGKPTEAKTIQLMTNRRIRRMEQTCEAICRVISALPEDKYRLVELKYWTKPQLLTDAGIYSQLNIEKSAYYEWVNQIVGAIGVEMGLISPHEIAEKRRSFRGA